uniref:SMP-LTD domain-containing protein n=1 Tax=Photinus pyralis TaxID=7054 RepID=A0A1Y1M6M5_PHOPY
MNTSVPSIAIRFNANAEEIEELYQSEDEPIDKLHSDKGTTDADTSPLRYLPRLGKRCTSIDTSFVAQDSSPPSDRWKFFTEIKGKITKSVEEIKQRNQEADSLIRKAKDTKDHSSLSDSDELSESSLSRTCGVSTTEGVEMSTDDETPSLEKDKRPSDIARNSTKHYRYKTSRSKRSRKDDNVNIANLAELYEITTGSKPNLSMHDAMSHDSLDVESGVEALEDAQPQAANDAVAEESLHFSEDREGVLLRIADHIENIEVQEGNKVKVLPVAGSTIKHTQLKENSSRTYFEPQGFVDLRVTESNTSLANRAYNFRYLLAVVLCLLCHIFSIIPFYVYGFLSGIFVVIVYNKVYSKYFELAAEKTSLCETFVTADSPEQAIFEIPAVKEYHQITKVEGWMNEYPDVYDPQTYHISQTQSVYIRLQGTLLRISHTKAKVSKRALWNEPKHKHIVFSGHRIYNLLGAHVSLLPVALNRRRHWSKKYPICITINKENLHLNSSDASDLDEGQKSKTKSEMSDKKSKAPKKESITQTQIFSKLTEEEMNLEECESAQVESLDPASKTTEEGDENGEADDEDDFKEICTADDEQDDESFNLDWTTFVSDGTPTETHIYLFARSDREKEDWYRRFVTATHRDSDCRDSQRTDTNVWNEREYLTYMNKYQKLYDDSKSDTKASSNVAWINCMISRILFDCTRDPTFLGKLQQRIQRKLSSIKLPYFIEQLSISELSLGNNPPLIYSVGSPTLDQRGLWIDLDVRYNGSLVLKLQTKLNLMKLKHLPASGSCEDSSFAKWQYSDVDDTAESSSDGESYAPSAGKVAEANANTTGSGGTSNSSKKLFKMVDKIAESKFFQAATENRYIKKAMEGVSNTDLSLKVELKGFVGTLVLNMPPPPSDRVWIGFRPLPQLWLSAHPIVGERNFSFIKQLTTWIEKKLTQEFQKVLVIPNMEDIAIPVMSSALPT